MNRTEDRNRHLCIRNSRVFSAGEVNVLEGVLTEVHISVHHIRRFVYNLFECQLLSKSEGNFYSVQEHVPVETRWRLSADISAHIHFASI